ncbi:diguanylate cyclase [Aliikangiella marina]|uniref:Diguanylate cyclase n=1 Tax=Aliikangiella marina TaxID=1712262 RepID=A0A545TBV3_9GAMM|nr:GGDEF domain-containing protein [Aliikangiella marina]TQV74681.1 diguanylate cyclase [Aliikangiella marina]
MSSNKDYFDAEFYAASIEAIQDGVFVVRDGLFVLANQAFAELMALPKARILGQSITRFVADDYVAKVAQRYRERVNGGTPPESYQIEVIRGDGEVRLVNLKVKAFAAKDGQVYEVVSVRDVTDRDKLLAKLEHSEREFKQIIDNLPGVFYRTDAQGQLIKASPYAFKLLGYQAEEAIGMPIADFYAEPYMREAVLEKILAANGDPVELETLMRCRDGAMVWVSTRAYARFNKAGEFIGVEGISLDITNRKKLENELREKAIKDPLTHLLNRYGLQEHLDKSLSRARRNQSQVALIYIDIDDFKQVNDRLGHTAGDSYLVEFSRRLFKNFRESDVISRIGGDEFVVVLDDKNLVASREEFLERLETIMRPEFVIENTPLEFKYSSGVALYPEHGITPEELLNYADQKMYIAKQEDDSNQPISQSRLAQTGC